MKKLLSLLLALCLAFGSLPFGVSAAENPYKGKVFSILGDSISTFEGYIPTADGFNLEHLTTYPQPYLLMDVSETWWMQVIEHSEAKLGINDSWGGSSVSGAEKGGESSCMSNLVRIRNLGSNGTPDVILFYGGTNDLVRAEVGQFDPALAPQTVDLLTGKWSTLTDGYVNTLLRMKLFYPKAQIVCILPTYTRYFYTDEKLDQANEILIDICEHYGLPYVDLRYCGITKNELPDGVHPNAIGMDFITDAVTRKLAECEIESGENIVYSITHKLTDAKSSMGYYKGISHGNAFSTKITGNNPIIRVSMGGKDITKDCYANGIVRISAATGDIVIEEKDEVVYTDRLQQLPQKYCENTNLWPLLEHQGDYCGTNGWEVHPSGNVYSVTVPIQPGDRLWATSFQTAGLNGGDVNGIRIAWFSEKGILKAVDTAAVYKEFSANGYITAPANAVAVNIPMWSGDDANEFYILSREHSYRNGACVICGKRQPSDDIKLTSAVTVGTTMNFNYSITAEDMSKYVDFMLVIRHDTADGRKLVTTYNSREMAAVKHPVSGKILMYNASYKNIAAKEMGDQFTATLYAVSNDGKMVYGSSITSSVKHALLERMSAPLTTTEWKTMAIDMLKYGAAAQIHFGYNTENLVTAGLTAEHLSYATTKIPAATDRFAVNGTGCNVSTSITLGAKVELHLSCIERAVSDPTAVKCVITDENGVLLSEVSAANIANIMFTATYADVGAKNMRQLITATFCEGDTPISKSITWSVESYVAQICSNPNSTVSEIRMAVAMLVYGDSVAAYMASK